jgi:hypothetical protein
VAEESDLAEARRLHERPRPSIPLDTDRSCAPRLGAVDGLIIPDSWQPRYGEKEVGYVEHRFEPDGAHASALVRVAGLKRLDISDFSEAAYGIRP